MPRQPGKVHADGRSEEDIEGVVIIRRRALSAMGDTDHVAAFVNQAFGQQETRG